jgi:transcriptional regulator with XRE-family HTH domain
MKKNENIKVYEPFSERLTGARKVRNLTQIELAKLSGVKNTTIAHFEAGDRQPSIDNLRRIAKAMKTSADYLLGFTSNIDFIHAIPSSFERYMAQMTSRDIALIKGIMRLMIEKQNEAHILCPALCKRGRNKSYPRQKSHHKKIAANDGFNDVNYFEAWFSKYKPGKMAILHFTDFRY